MDELHVGVDLAGEGTSDSTVVTEVVNGDVVEFVAVSTESEAAAVIRRNRPYRLHRGRMFLYEGRVGERYMIADCNKVVQINNIGMGSVSVTFPSTGVTYGIALNTEVIPFDPVKHADLVKRIPKVKAEEETEA